MVFIRSRLLYFVLSFICLIVVPLQAAPENSIPDCFSTAWPHELSELLPDPDLTFGRLGNGFRYVLKTNREPRDRVGLFLDVQVGSLHEKETEQGIAHFLEHMELCTFVHLSQLQ